MRDESLLVEIELREGEDILVDRLEELTKLSLILLELQYSIMYTYIEIGYSFGILSKLLEQETLSERIIFLEHDVFILYFIIRFIRIIIHNHLVIGSSF